MSAAAAAKRLTKKGVKGKGKAPETVREKKKRVSFKSNGEDHVDAFDDEAEPKRTRTDGACYVLCELLCGYGLWAMCCVPVECVSVSVCLCV